MEILILDGISATNTGTVIYCNNNVGISIKTSSQEEANTGGIVGGNGNRIERCINYGSISGIDKHRILYIGGIAGINRYETYNGIINECINKADLNVGFIDDSSGTRIGTYGGICANSNGTITNCYNTGNILRTSEDDFADISGISADTGNSEYNLCINNCYSVGNMQNTVSTTEVSTYAAFTFSEAKDFISNCYYNSDICSATEYNATGMTTAQMKSVSFVALLGDAFTQDTNNINNGYPILKWEQ